MDVGNDAGGEQNGIMFEGTFNPSLGSNCHTTSASSGNATVETDRDTSNGSAPTRGSPQESKNAKVQKYLSKSFLHSADPAKSSPQREPVGRHPGRDLQGAPEGRCHSQPTMWNPSEDSQCNPKSSSPFPFTRQPTPPHLSPLGHPHSAPRPVTLGASPTNPNGSNQQQKFRWGSADRPCSPLLSCMPNISSRFNRDKSEGDSPVPYSPHRWLLWRREKSSPNTLNSSMQDPKWILKLTTLPLHYANWIPSYIAVTLRLLNSLNSFMYNVHISFSAEN